MLSQLITAVLLSELPDTLDNIRLTLEASSAGWFNRVTWAGYAVALGCLMEAPESFITIKRWWLLKFSKKDYEETQQDRESWRIPLAAVGLIIIVIGIVLETFGESKVSTVDALLRSHESDKISVAEHDAATATRDAGEAGKSALKAAGASNAAEKSSSKTAAAAKLAVASSGNAVMLASQARHEAASYAKGIADARQSAATAVLRLAEAESRLAASTEREAAAEAKLLAIKTPRSFINAERLITILRSLGQTEYTLNVFQDDEALQFAKLLDEKLREAGWVRKQKDTYRLGIPSYNLFSGDGSNSDESVPICVETGIQLHVRSTMLSGAINTTPDKDRPSSLRNAVILQAALQSSIAPPEELNVGKTLRVDDRNLGEGPIVICVGKKP